MDLYFNFYDTSTAVIKMMFLVITGFIVFRFNIIDEIFLTKMSALLINILFPALIMYKTVTNFNFGAFPLWWLVPLVSGLFSLGGMIIGLLIFKLARFSRDKDEFICSVAFQNAGYLPMNIILFSFNDALGDKLLIYLFLFLAGFNLVVWTLVPLFLRRGKSERVKVHDIINAPVIATFLSIVWVRVFGNNSMPAIIMDPLKQVGNISFPIAMIVLGGYLCLYRAYIPENKTQLMTSVLSRLIFFPLIVFAILCFIKASQDFRFFILLEAIMPSAVSLVVIGAFSDKNNRFFSSAIFYSHIFSIFTIPLWLEVSRMAFRA